MRNTHKWCLNTKHTQMYIILNWSLIGIRSPFYLNLFALSLNFTFIWWSFLQHFLSFIFVCLLQMISKDKMFQICFILLLLVLFDMPNTKTYFSHFNAHAEELAYSKSIRIYTHTCLYTVICHLQREKYQHCCLHLHEWCKNIQWISTRRVH